MSMGVPGREGLEPQFKVGDRVETVGLGDSIIFTIQQVWHDGEDWCYDRNTGQCYTARHLKLLPEEQMVDVCQIIATLIRASDPNSEHEFNWSRKYKLPQSQLRAILAPYMEGSDE